MSFFPAFRLGPFAAEWIRLALLYFDMGAPREARARVLWIEFIWAFNSTGETTTNPPSMASASSVSMRDELSVGTLDHPRMLFAPMLVLGKSSLKGRAVYKVS
ncbi:uncharacterized protein MCYG_03716 [Microsporum canis CBS 113480]|uniref:Uncharacterized protein n=1 Tax=Arthroderma otae (strain ATCC MYA-4605 / CBS 113480) TaxID=554155 RepID=C5FJN6_ARTOC|nr:uncharacterized protein MCYG_03716 [Microsporum canis CBS 113480]EEQ30897.1 predicted protein [Microsporum canis CBS 113480]